MAITYISMTPTFHKRLDLACLPNLIFQHHDLPQNVNQSEHPKSPIFIHQHPP
ncbi:hypothetical protein Sjap_025338 [Stephania japonica]|uniref:Uncharacterized protein n=1 Tax=Stephania japonica TaxID=461633 RepID=A0AAP0HHG2_9MAGN